MNPPSPHRLNLDPVCSRPRAVRVALSRATAASTSPYSLSEGSANRPFLKRTRERPKHPQRALGNVAKLDAASWNPDVVRRRDPAAFRVLLHQGVRSSPVLPGLADTLMAFCSSRADSHASVWFFWQRRTLSPVPPCPRNPRGVASLARQRRS